MMVLLVALGAVASLVGMTFAYIGYRLEQPPVGPPTAVREAFPDTPLLVCLGDSHTHGRVGSDWVSMLRTRVEPALVVGNSGKNGDLAWNAAQRLPECLAGKPRAMVLLVGSNDVMAADDEGRARVYLRQNKLPELPSIGWSKQQFVDLLTAMAQAVPHVAVCTIPPLGALADAPVAAAVRDWNEHVRTTAAQVGATVLDVHAATEPLNASGTRAYVAAFSGVVKELGATCSQRFLMGRSWDDIADARGFGLTMDGIHLPDRAGVLVAGLVEEWLADSRTVDTSRP